MHYSYYRAADGFELRKINEKYRVHTRNTLLVLNVHLVLFEVVMVLHV